MKLADGGPLAARRKQGGMTLVEMLVVLAIIAVIATIVTLSLGSGRGMNGQAEARQLAARLQLAADQSMISDESVALALEKDGYRFVEWDQVRGEWGRKTNDVLSERKSLPEGMSLRSEDARSLLPLGADAAGQAFSLTLSSEARSWRVEFDGMTARMAAERRASAVETGQ